jgi:pilus assembly protein Flp/PilA
MNTLLASIEGFAADEHGATAIEYGLLSGLIAVACIVGFVVFGDSVEGLFGTTENTAGAAIAAAADSL